MPNKIDSNGHAYREVKFRGETYILSPGTSKITLLEEYGIVFVGPSFSFTAPKGTRLAGQTFKGYTNQEPFVSEFRAMLAELAALAA